jgi:hypothetical protein
MSNDQKTVRIIALNASLQRANHVRVVNVFTTAPARNEFPTVLQALTAAAKKEYPEWMASGAANPVNTQGLPNIFIAGFSGPS